MSLSSANQQTPAARSDGSSEQEQTLAWWTRRDAGGTYGEHVHRTDQYHTRKQGTVGTSKNVTHDAMVETVSSLLLMYGCSFSRSVAFVKVITIANASCEHTNMQPTQVGDTEGVQAAVERGGAATKAAAWYRGATLEDSSWTRAHHTHGTVQLRLRFTCASVSGINRTTAALMIRRYTSNTTSM